MKEHLRHSGAMARTFWREERGQDLLEHSLLIAFVALAAATLFMGSSSRVNTIWTMTNHTLMNASNSPRQIP